MCGQIAITNREVADATGISRREVLISGKSPGTITLIAWGDAMRVQYDLEVDPGMRTLRPGVVERDEGARQKRVTTDPD